MVEFGHKKIKLFVILFIYIYIYASPPPKKRSYLMVVPYVYIICYCEPSLFVLPAYEAYEESPLLQHHCRYEHRRWPGNRTEGLGTLGVWEIKDYYTLGLQVPPCRGCLGWFWRVQTPSEEVLGALGICLDVGVSLQRPEIVAPIGGVTRPDIRFT